MVAAASITQQSWAEFCWQQHRWQRSITNNNTMFFLANSTARNATVHLERRRAASI